MGAGVWLAVRAYVRTLDGLQPGLAAAVTAASATIIVSVLTVMITRAFERRAVREAEIRAEKIPVYDEFIEFWFRYMQGERAGIKKPDDKELMRFMMSFTRRLMMWGSDDVVVRWSQWRRRFTESEESQSRNPRAVMLEFGELLLAMRRDTGHANRDVST